MDEIYSLLRHIIKKYLIGDANFVYLQKCLGDFRFNDGILIY